MESHMAMATAHYSRNEARQSRVSLLLAPMGEPS